MAIPWRRVGKWLGQVILGKIAEEILKKVKK
jgi:hypothetical protein